MWLKYIISLAILSTFNIFNQSTISAKIFPRKATVFGIINTLNDYVEWVEKDEKLFPILTNRRGLIETEIDLIATFLNDYKESTVKAINHLNKSTTAEKSGKIVGSSAILGHRMTSRYAGVITNLRELLNSSEYHVNQAALNQALEIPKGSTSWIETLELHMSMNGLTQIQEVYDYTPEMIYHLENKVGIELTLDQCAEIASFQLNRGNYYMSVEWLQFTVNRTEEYETYSNFPIDLAISLAMLSIQEHNRILNDGELKNNGAIQLNLYSHPIPQDRVAKRKVLYLHGHTVNSEMKFDAQFMARCRGNVAQSLQVKKHLKCYYESRRHPYLYINPVKVELLSESPPIWQFYEMINERNTQQLHKFARGKLTPEPFGFKGEYDTLENKVRFRTSAATIIPREIEPMKALKLADIVTGVNIWDNWDGVHYTEYTYGRFHAVHSDALAPVINDRLVTMLYYLEVPENSGYTGFCQAGVFPRPVRRSSVFWYNLYKNGTERLDVHHGGCPVIQGHKIVLSHGSRQFVNWQKHKCSLNQFE